MYYYFCAEYPAVIKFNGVYQGLLEGDVRSVNYSNTTPLFVEICPLIQSENTVNLLLTDNFFVNPPQSVTLTDLKGGYLIKLQKTDCNNRFSVITQLKDQDFVATVFYDGGLNFSFESRNGIFTDKLPNYSGDITINALVIEGKPFVAVNFTGQKPLLILYKIYEVVDRVLQCNGEIEFLHQTTTNGKNYYTDFVVTERLDDIAKHVIKRQLNCNNGKIDLKIVSSTICEDFCLDKLNEKILPYAFFEEIYAGGDINPFLCPTLKTNANKLIEFLGDFIGVMPPPPFREIEEVGLIKKIDGNKYSVDYYKFQFENGKISNVIRLDD